MDELFFFFAEESASGELEDCVDDRLLRERDIDPLEPEEWIDFGRDFLDELNSASDIMANLKINKLKINK